MNAMGALELTDSLRHQFEIIESWLQRRKQVDRDIQILEAGCGQRWDLNLGNSGYFLTGVDLDSAALKLRIEISKDLHRAVEGDLRSVQFEPGSFDVIYNSFVLEHVPGAARVLANFVTWLRPDGLAVIRIPDPFSVHGFLARSTPHWFHVLVYRHVLGAANAGRPGYGPYPVHYDEVVSREGIREFCRENDLTLAAEYGSKCNYGTRKGLVQKAIPAVKGLISLLSMGRLSAKHDNLLYILQKN